LLLRMQKEQSAWRGCGTGVHAGVGGCAEVGAG